MDNWNINKPSLTPNPTPAFSSRIISLLKKPWFIILLTGVIIFIVAGLSINRVMTTILHARAEVAVPQLEGKGLMESMRVVSEVKLSLREEGTEFDESLPAGTVLRQHPPAGMRVREGRAISVVISKGGQVVFVPGIMGKPLAEAQSVLSADRLQVGAVSSIYSIDVPEGLVVSQNPSSGTVVTRGALIDISVSKGLPPAGVPTLPDFKGQTVDNVREWAQGVGGQIKVSENEKAVGMPGTVVKQDPAPGQPLMEGDLIKISVVPLTSKGGNRFQYQVPADKGAVSLRVVARDSRGESQIYKGDHKGGDTIQLPISVTSATRLRVYLDDVLVDEKVLEP